jgi:hypothetical protein
MEGTKIYELPLARDYVRGWGVKEAVRELIQNAIDSPAPFEYSQGNELLTITSRGVRLDASTLVLGRTSKADDDDQIGQFGEGYKLAMLVLTREGKALTIANGDKLWKPEFRMSRQFGVETLHILETDIDQTDRLDFMVGSLTDDDQQAIIDSCLMLQPAQCEVIRTDRGDILPERPGKLYVGGLYICDTDLKYGYNFKPCYMPLERDRKTVDSWELQAATKDIWFDTHQHDKIAELIAADVPDVKYAEYSSSEQVREACYRHFQKNHAGKVIARNQEELNELVKRGMSVYVGGGAYYSNVSRAESYKNSYAPPRKIPPEEFLRGWLKDNESAMLPRTIKAFQSLIQQSKKWTAS